jgi:hypothetical protein
MVSVGEDYTYGCDDYLSFLDSDEYRDKFYKAVKTDDNKTAKAVDFGKKIELNGRVFFTKCKIMEDESHTVTDKRTGLLVRSIAWLKENWERFLELEQKVADVDSLPYAVEKGGKYHITKDTEGKTDEQSLP